MGRKRKLDCLPAGVKARLLAIVRENRLTLDGMMQALREEFPALAAAGGLPSRSGVGRYQRAEGDIIKEQRAQAQLGDRVVEALGENKDSKYGALLSQTLTLLMNRTLLQRMESGGPIEIGDLLALARAGKAAQETSSLNLRQRQAVAKEEREKMLAEQRAQAEELTKSGMAPQEVLAAVIRAGYGL